MSDTYRETDATTIVWARGETADKPHDKYIDAWYYVIAKSVNNQYIEYRSRKSFDAAATAWADAKPRHPIIQAGSFGL